MPRVWPVDPGDQGFLSRRAARVRKGMRHVEEDDDGTLDTAICVRCHRPDEPVTGEGLPRYRGRLKGTELAKVAHLPQEITEAQRRDFYKQVNQKRMVYHERCLHESYFLRYTNTDITCQLCGATGPRGATLNHVL